MSDPFATGLTGVAAMFAPIVLQVPVGVAMGVVGVVGTGFIIGFGSAFTLLATEPPAAMAAEGLAVIAMFLLMGNLAHVGGLSAELYRLAQVFLGHRRGGLIFATIGACAGFGAVCGSSVATAATMVRIALPEMLSRGYARSLAAGSIASGGTLGMIVPPSVVMILFAILTEDSIIALFLAAVIPGLLAAAFYFAAITVTVRPYLHLAPLGERSDWRTRGRVARQNRAVLLLAVVVSGGIFSGVFTATEAASVGATMALALALLRRRLTGRTFLEALGDTASNTELIFVIIIGASVFSQFATLSGMPGATVAWIEGLGLPPLVVIFCLLGFYLVLGSIFDTIAAMVLTLPFVYPLVIGLGYDPVWWGVINIAVIELGMITPPIGNNVFVLHGMARDLPLGQIFRGVVPFLIADLARLVLLLLAPPLSLWLPRALGWM